MTYDIGIGPGISRRSLVNFGKKKSQIPSLVNFIWSEWLADRGVCDGSHTAVAVESPHCIDYISITLV